MCVPVTPGVKFLAQLAVMIPRAEFRVRRKISCGDSNVLSLDKICQLNAVTVHLHASGVLTSDDRVLLSEGGMHNQY